jgi:hypothetical protein
MKLSGATPACFKIPSQRADRQLSVQRNYAACRSIWIYAFQYYVASALPNLAEA